MGGGGIARSAKVLVRLLLGAAWLLAGCTSPARATPVALSTAPALPTSTPRSDIYGASFSEDYLDLSLSLPALDQAAALGIGWVRFSINWEQVEPTLGKFDWHLHDQIVA